MPIEVIWECGTKRLEVHHAPHGRVVVLADGGTLKGVWPLPVRAGAGRGHERGARGAAGASPS
jgi:hypothetical protein